MEDSTLEDSRLSSILENIPNNEPKIDSVLGVKFSPDGSMFSVATTTGFGVYNADPVKLRYKQDFGKGIGFAVIYKSTNIVALVGGGDDPMFPKENVIIWDDNLDQIVHEIAFETNVLNLLFSDDRLHVVLKNKLYEYKFPFPSGTEKQTAPNIYVTADNPHGAFAFFNSGSRETLATIDEKSMSSIRVIFPKNMNDKQPLICPEYYYYKSATEQPLAILRFSSDGKILASIKQDGLHVSIWDLENLKKYDLLLIKHSNEVEHQH